MHATGASCSASLPNLGSLRTAYAGATSLTDTLAACAQPPAQQCGKHHRAPQCAQPRHPGVPHAGGTSAAPAVPPLEVPRSDTGLYPGRLLSPSPYVPLDSQVAGSNPPRFFTFFCFCLSVLMQFLRLSFSGLGRSVPNHHKFSNPVPGWRFVVIWQVFLIVRMLLQFSQIQFPAARRF